MHMPPGGSPHNSPPQPSAPPPKGGGGEGKVDRLVIFHLQPQLAQLHNRATLNRNKPTIETPQMLLAGLCPGQSTCPRPAGGSSGQNVATLTRRQSLSSHPELCPGSWGQVPPDTNWSGGKRLPSQTCTGPPKGPSLCSGTRLVQPSPASQGDAWAQIQLALPVRHWCRTEGTRLSPSQPSLRAPKLEGRGDSPPLHIWPWPPGSAVENSRPRFSLSLPPPSLCPLPASGTAPAPASGQQGPHPSSLSWPLRLAGGWGVRLLGNPSSSHQSSSPAPKLWVAVPFPVEQETRLFPRLRASPLPLWLCPGTRTQQGKAP